MGPLTRSKRWPGDRNAYPNHPWVGELPSHSLGVACVQRSRLLDVPSGTAMDDACTSHEVLGMEGTAVLRTTKPDTRRPLGLRCRALGRTPSKVCLVPHHQACHSARHCLSGRSVSPGVLGEAQSNWSNSPQLWRAKDCPSTGVSMSGMQGVTLQWRGVTQAPPHTSQPGRK